MYLIFDVSIVIIIIGVIYSSAFLLHLLRDELWGFDM
jgi:hypothetical protein